MNTAIQSRKITLIYRNIKTDINECLLTYYFKKITYKFKLDIDLITLGLGVSPYEDGTHTIRIFFYFKKKRHIVRFQKYFSFILDHPCEIYKSRSKVKELDLITKMTTSRCWGDTGVKTNLEAVLIEKEIREGRTPVMFFDIEDSSLRHLLYHCPTKIERYSKYQQLYNHIENLRTKSHSIFDLNKVYELGQDPKLNYSPNALKKLLEILSYLNTHADPSKREYKAKMLHLWSNRAGLGKSSILNILRTYTPCYRWPDDNWFDHYENNLYQWILWDEFRLVGQSNEFLKRFFAGDAMTLPVKGTHSYKKDNPLVILTSNFSLEKQVQRKIRDKFLSKIELEAFKARIHEIELTESIINCEFKVWEGFIKNCLMKKVK